MTSSEEDRETGGKELAAATRDKTGSARLLTYRRAELVRRKVGFSRREFAEFLGVDPRTYARRSQEKHLKRSESMQVELVEGVLAEAARVFRDEALAREWLVSSIISLDKRRPIDHLDSIRGYERVKNTLVKIEYGMY